MEIPINLSHKPIYAIEGYSIVDGEYKNKSDVQGFSIGKAQWVRDDQFSPSIKIWRHDGNQWSPQSEETTLTRAIDATTLIVHILNNIIYNTDDTKILLENEIFNIYKKASDEKFVEYVQKNKRMIVNHLRSLKKEIDTFGM